MVALGGALLSLLILRLALSYGFDRGQRRRNALIHVVAGPLIFFAQVTPAQLHALHGFVPSACSGFIFSNKYHDIYVPYFSCKSFLRQSWPVITLRQFGAPQQQAIS